MLNSVQASLAGISMPPTLPVPKKPAGGRISTPKLRASLKDAEEFVGLKDGANRYELLTLVKRAGKTAGFSKSMILLLDYYMAFTKEIDWQEGHSPIVYKTLQRTAMDFGVTERQIQKLENQLFEVGAITWQDSGNHRRYGRRCDKTDAILEAYGVDLTPLAVLRPKLEKNLAEKQQERKEWESVKDQISYYRRQILAGLGALEQVQSAESVMLNKQYEDINMSIRTYMSLEKLNNLLVSHKELHNQVFGLFECVKECELLQKSSSTDEIKFRHIESTIKKQISKDITSSDKRICFQEGCSRSSDDKTETSEKTDKSKVQSIPESAGLQHITLKQVINAASPRFKDHIPLEPRPAEFRDLVEAAYSLAPDLYITKGMWSRAVQTLGRNGAAICLLLTDKGLDKEINPVRKPANYFNAMVTRAQKSELHLQKSIMGILKRENEAEYAT